MPKQTLNLRDVGTSMCWLKVVVVCSLVLVGPSRAQADLPPFTLDRFYVFDNSGMNNAPLDRDRFAIVYSHELWPSWDRVLPPTVERLSAALARYEAGTPIMLDIENWDPYGDSERAAVDREKLLETLRRARQVRPDLYYGYYKVVPRTDFYRATGRFGEDSFQEWQAENDTVHEIAASVDFVCPAIYTWWHFGWEGYARAVVTEARRMANGKPVIPLVWTRFHPGGTFKPELLESTDVWCWRQVAPTARFMVATDDSAGRPWVHPEDFAAQVEVCREIADSVVVWGHDRSAEWSDHAWMWRDDVPRPAPTVPQLRNPLMLAYGSEEINGVGSLVSVSLKASDSDETSVGEGDSSRDDEIVRLREPVDVAREVAQDLLRRHVGERAVVFDDLELVQIGGSSLFGDDFETAVDPDAVQARLEAWSGWMDAFWAELRLQGVAPGFVVTDIRGGVAPGDFGLDLAHTVSTPELDQYLQGLAAWSSDSTMRGSNHTLALENVDDLAQFSLAIEDAAARMKADVINQVIYESFATAFETPIAGTNLGATARGHIRASQSSTSDASESSYNPADQLTQHLPTPDSATPGTHASPVAWLDPELRPYLLPESDIEGPVPTGDDAHIQSWLERRRAVAEPAARIRSAPWYSSPSDGLPGRSHWHQWRAGIIDDRMAGAEIFLVWGPQTSEEAQYTAAVAAELLNVRPMSNYAVPSSAQAAASRLRFYAATEGDR